MERNGTRVLVVEDSMTQALMLTALLADQGIHADHSETAEQALKYLGRNRPDLILIDFHLPSMRGDELCRQIRMNPATADILVLILTDDTQDAVERQGLESGADDHIPKSIATDGLMARINALLRNQRRTRGALFRPQANYFQRPRLVAVDDSPTFLGFIREELDHESYEVTTFTEGERAFEHVARIASWWISSCRAWTASSSAAGWMDCAAPAAHGFRC
jgi:two-component system NtrC family sensor kinase